jgi:hypothetical protein
MDEWRVDGASYRRTPGWIVGRSVVATRPLSAVKFDDWATLGKLMRDKSNGEGGCPVRFAPLQVSLHRSQRSSSRIGHARLLAMLGRKDRNLLSDRKSQFQFDMSLL